MDSQELSEEAYNYIKELSIKTGKPWIYTLNKLVLDQANKKKKALAKVEKEAAKFDLSSWPYLPDPDIFKDWIKAKGKKGSVSPTTMKSVGKVLHKLVLDGVTVDEALSIAESGGWQGFRYEWFEKEIKNKSNNQSRTIDNLTDRGWANG